MNAAQPRTRPGRGTMRRSIERRLAALERATTLPDERPMITIVVYDETPDRVVRRVMVPMGTPAGAPMDYRKIMWHLRPAEYDGADDVQAP